MLRKLLKYDLQNMATFGVAGNFTGHLEQAGEAKDFDIKSIAEIARYINLCLTISNFIFTYFLA